MAVDCPNPNSTDYGSFSLKLHQKGAEQQTPLNGTLEITERCNLRCQHCYVPMPARQGAANYAPIVPRRETAPNHASCVVLPEVVPAHRQVAPLALQGQVSSISTAIARAESTFDEICHLLDDLADEGCLWLLMTGGEPLARPDFLDIYDYAKRKGFLITLFTNGTMITEEIAEHFASFTAFSVEITLYGATRETYEAVTNVPGSFERCLRAIDLMVERKIPLQLKTMVVFPNRHELADMGRLARDRGLSFRWDALVHQTIHGCPEPLTTRLAPEEIVSLDLADQERIQAWRDLMKMAHGRHRSDQLFGCSAGNGSFHIDAFGYLQLCGFARRYSYDLRLGSFQDGYRRYFSHVRSLRRQLRTICDSCDLFAICGICPAWEEMDNQGQEGPVEFIHQYACLLAAKINGNKQSDYAPAIGFQGG